MNKLLRNILICVLLIGFLLGAVYISFCAYFTNVFQMNTWINGIYCTGKTPEEVNKELLLRAEAPFLSIQDTNGVRYEITPDQIQFRLDYAKELNQLFAQQHVNPWTDALLNCRDFTVIPGYSYDKELLKTAAEQLDFVKEEERIPVDLKIVMNESGYELSDTTKMRLNKDTLFQFLEEVMDHAALEADGSAAEPLLFDLKDRDLYKQCYEDLELSPEQQEELEIWKTVEDYIHSGIVYDMGDEEIMLSGKIASGFLLTNDDGEFCFDQTGQPMMNTEEVKNFVNSLADEYNTYKTELTFLSSAGEEKTIPYLNYGTEINVEKEIEYLMAAFAEKRSERHIPSYSREGYARGKNDIGDTYIEIDMGYQKLYAYVDGELLVETDIVTGNMKRKWSTPEGVVYIYKKQRNRTLRGPGYASFVKYWMPVKGGIGLHDASWRKEFGGEIYKTDGSHGCINVPRDVMGEIYENFEVGTPVVMFY